MSLWSITGGRLVFSYWLLNSDAQLQNALSVTTAGDLSTTLPVHSRIGTPVDFFTLVDTFPSPLVFAGIFPDNGDILNLAGDSDGFLAASFSSPESGQGAIAVTNGDRSIVMGFLPADIEFSGTDADEDGVNDVVELYRNQIRFLCSQSEPVPAITGARQRFTVDTHSVSWPDVPSERECRGANEP